MQENVNKKVHGELFEKMENSCRLCLDGNCTIKCILSASDEVNCFWDVRDLVKEAVGIEIRSKDPVRGLCGACVNMLHSVVKFRRKCHETNRIVLEMTVPDEEATGGYFVEVEEPKIMMMPKEEPGEVIMSNLASEETDDILIPLPEVKMRKRDLRNTRRSYRIRNPNNENHVDNSSQIKIEDGSQKEAGIVNFISLEEIKVEKEDDPLVESIDFMMLENVTIKEESTSAKKTKKRDSMTLCQTPKEPKNPGKRKYTKKKEKAEKIKEKTDKPQRKNRKIEKSGLCEICGVHFSNISYHMAQHDPALRIYKCDICGKTFVIKDLLRKHKKGHDEENHLTCSFCNAKLKTKKTLLQHLKTHSDEFPFKCDVCGRGFRHQKNLPAHKRTHTGEKPYHCRICDLRFTSRPAIRQHMRIRHDEK